MRFMLTFTWKKPPDAEVMAAMPAEQARVKELAEQGTAESLELAADQSIFWAVWNCASEDEVQKILLTLPMHKFQNVDVSPLAPKEQ